MQLVGRRYELDVLHDSWARATSGRRTVVAVRGVPGIGKSSLLHELRRRVSATGTVLTASLTEAETFIGWAGVATLLRGLDPEALEVGTPAQRLALSQAMGAVQGSGELEPLTVASALEAVLAAGSTSRPIALVLDDLHWLDAASAGALTFAIRLLADRPILVVLASRPIRLPIDLGRAVDAGDLVEIELGPLSVAGVSQLLESKFGVQLGRVDLVHLHTITEGNPLHTFEVGRLLERGHALGDALRSATLDGAIDATVAELAQADRPVLRAAALIAEPTLAELRRICPDDDIARTIDAAESLGLVAVEGQVVRFRHPLLRAAVERTMPTGMRLDLHRRLAELSDDLDVRSIHLSAATVEPDPAVAETLSLAAEAALSRGMPVEAARHARRALELTPPDLLELLDLRRLLAAQALLESGDSRSTLALLLPSVDEPRPAERQRRLLLTVARAVSESTVTSDCVPWIRRAVEIAEPRTANHVRDLLLLSRAMMFADLVGAGRVAVEALHEAEQLGDQTLVDDARAASIAIQFLTGEDVDVEPLFAAVAAASPGSSTSAWGILGELMTWSDRHDESKRLHQAELADRDVGGHVLGVLDTLSQLIDVHLRGGELEQADVLIERSLALAVATGNRSLLAARLGDQSVVLAMRGQPFQQQIDDIDDLSADLSVIERMLCRALVGYACLLGGDATSAAIHLRKAHTSALAVGLSDLGALPYHANLVEALIAVDAIDEAAEAVVLIEATAAKSRRPRAVAESSKARAMLCAAQGDLDAADAAVQRALSAHAEIPVPIERGRVLMLSGVIARRRRQRTQARQLFVAAQALFQDSGATALLARVGVELERVGGSSDGSLTATEQQIAQLVVAGRSNDQIAAELFITRRTVEANLTRAYRKLGVRSRTELSALLRNPRAS